MRLGLQNAIVEDHFLPIQTEVVRVAGDQELQAYLHQFLARKVRPRQAVEHAVAVLSEEVLSLLDSLGVGVLQLQPPISLHLPEGCRGYGQHAHISLDR